MTAVVAILKLICIAEDISEDIYLQKIAVFRKKSYPLGTTKYIETSTKCSTYIYFQFLGDVKY